MAPISSNVLGVRVVGNREYSGAWVRQGLIQEKHCSDKKGNFMGMFSDLSAPLVVVLYCG